MLFKENALASGLVEANSNKQALEGGICLVRAKRENPARLIASEPLEASESACI